MLFRDLVVAWRKLLRRPGAAVLAVVSLALAIGFSTAAFSVVDAYYWRALPVQDPGRLAYAAVRDREGRYDNLTWPEFETIQQQGGTLAGIAVQDRRSPPVRLPDRYDFPITAGVSNNFFDVLGVKAARGRVFHPGAAEETQVVVSDRYWRRAFGGAPDMVGRTIELGRKPLTVIGVLPPGFSGTQRGIAVDLFIPEPAMFALGMSSPGNKLANFEPVLRIKPGADFDAARRDMEQALRRAESAGLAPGPGRKAFVLSFLRPEVKPETNMGDIFPWIALLVLTIAAANFANLRLVENQARRRETGIRLAIGAGRWSLLRQHLTESLLVAGMAAGLGLVIAQWLIDAAPSVLYAGSRYSEYFIRLDARVFAFCAAAMLLVAMMGALIPMRDTWRCSIVPALQATHVPAASRWLAGLVIVQIGLITAFTDAAGLLWRSRENVAAIRPAMDPDRKLLLVEGSWEQRGDAITVGSERLAADLREVPGVVNVAYGRRPMMAGYGGGQRVSFERPGLPALTFRFNQVSPEYFGATGARVLSGRAFSRADSRDATPAAMVSEAFSRKFFPKGDALNNWVKIAGKDRQIVGIVEDGPSHDLREAIEPFIYLPFSQRPSEDAVFFVETAANPSELIAPVREQVRKSNAGFMPFEIMTLENHLRAQRREEELAVDVSGGLAFLGMALAAAGLFGVTLYAVGRRMREFGVRVALGATPSALGAQVVREALKMALAGVVLGGALCFASLRLLRTYLFGVRPGDVGMFAAGAAAVTLVALAAALIPARRAARTDPMAALRVE